jgi:hypothetical protein
MLAVSLRLVDQPADEAESGATVQLDQVPGEPVIHDAQSAPGIGAEESLAHQEEYQAGPQQKPQGSHDDEHRLSAHASALRRPGIVGDNLN